MFDDDWYGKHCVSLFNAASTLIALLHGTRRWRNMLCHQFILHRSKLCYIRRVDEKLSGHAIWLLPWQKLILIDSELNGTVLAHRPYETTIRTEFWILKTKFYTIVNIFEQFANLEKAMKVALCKLYCVKYVFFRRRSYYNVHRCCTSNCKIFAQCCILNV